MVGRLLLGQWDSCGGSERTRYFMETLLSNLPQREKAYLAGDSLTILDWGCAFGEGVAALARAFPRSRVAGLDFSRTAIGQASVRNAGHEYIWSEDGAIPRNFDVIVTSNCLEYFDAPLAVLEKHLAACGSLYIVLAPYNESPLHPQHRVQFQAPSFPIRIGDFTRIHVEPLLVNRHYWPGEQFLVIYASGRYLRDSVDRPDPMAQAIARLEAARSQESRRADAAEFERNRQRQRAEEAEAALRMEREKWELLRAASETLRSAAIKGVRDFHAQFEKEISAYRSERAWRIMLAIRKAYTLLVRRKLGGISAFIGWSARAAMGKNTELEEFEPKFPVILNFVPRELFAAAATVRKPAVRRADRRYDIVVLPIFDYDFRFQRPQPIAVQFARSGHRVYWISPARYLPLSSAEAYESKQIGENVWEIHLRVAPFDLYRGALEPSQTAALLDSLGRLYRDLDLNASCVILQFPFWRQIGLGLRDKFGARVVYVSWTTGRIGPPNRCRAPSVSPRRTSSWLRAMCWLSPRASCATGMPPSISNPS